MEFITQVRKKMKTITNIFFIRPSSSPLQLSEFRIGAVEDYHVMHHLPEQYFRFSYIQVGEKCKTLIRFSLIRPIEPPLHPLELELCILMNFHKKIID